ncbi:MAG: alpha/beta fold hydrolase [Actinomycetota bacterium]
MAGVPSDVLDWQRAGRFVSVRGDEVFVVDVGGKGAETVLILHGFPGSSFDWRGVVPHLAERFRVLALDFLGYGLSAKPEEARFSLFEQADLVEEVARHAEIERCSLLSHDMGDSVAAELLMRSVEGRLSFGIDRATLTNGSIFIDMAQLSAGQEALLAMPDEPLADPLPLEAFRPGLAATFGSDHPPADTELEAMVWLIGNNNGDRLLPRLIRYIEERRENQDRWTAGLVEYPGPMTAIWGEQDPIAVVGMAHHLKELRPETEVVTWPDVGHWPSIEVPERLATAVADRLSVAW